MSHRHVHHHGVLVGAHAVTRPAVSRRQFLGAVGGLTAGAAALGVVTEPWRHDAAALDALRSGVEPFYGAHQGGITTAPQGHTVFAAFDVTTDRRLDLVDLLRSWTSIAASLTQGHRAPVSAAHGAGVAPDSGETLGLGPARLTVNVGFGPSLFGFDGPDRFGLGDKLPMQLVTLPAFPGDQLVESSTGGDLTVHACADDPQVAFHAVRQLVRAGAGVTTVRWLQAGFNEASAGSGTPRNLLGFKDGTINPAASQTDEYVWVGAEGPDWMIGGTYVVIRVVRMALADWDDTPLRDQERVIGRHKLSGAPLGASGEFDPLDLKAKDDANEPVIPMDAHVRLASPQENWGQMMLRRSYSYSNGVLGATPERPDAVMDAGILFAAYQRSPRFAFIPIYRNLAQHDALGAFTTHVGSAIAALAPAPTRQGQWIGQSLFEA